MCTAQGVTLSQMLELVAVAASFERVIEDNEYFDTLVATAGHNVAAYIVYCDDRAIVASIYDVCE